MAEGEKSKSDSFLTLVGRALEQGTKAWPLICLPKWLLLATSPGETDIKLDIGGG